MADHTVVIAEPPEHLWILINRIVECSEEYRLSLNISKTKSMMVSKPPQNECVRKYNYLGTVINENNDIGTCHTHFCCIITSLIAICIVDLKSSDLHATYST